MTAGERSQKWIEEIEEVDDMTLEELRAEVAKMAREESFLGVIASLALTKLLIPG